MASAAILNGGQARRFDGRHKGALVVAGRTIRHRQLAMLATFTDDILLAGSAVPESGYHPLCAVYRRTCLPAVSKRLASRRRPSTISSNRS